MSKDWKDLSEIMLLGHNVECSWLLWKAIKILEEPELEKHYQSIVIELVDSCIEKGLGEYGEIFDTYNFNTHEIQKERQWWMQAEGVISFLNAYALTENPKYIEHFNKIWNFIKTYQIDYENGDWHRYSTLDTVVDNKVSNWKAPYHNGRCMLEAISRIEML